ncbi:MAG TPA: 30S ribosomal protein S9 [Planctomycetota bacterium]|nr:30S ribosomal protein S9 [Planctomycetota bacterium]
MASKKDDRFTWGTGRRKTAIARVRVMDGNGRIIVNKRDVEDYFKTPAERLRVLAPLEAVDCTKSVDVFINTHGGGLAAQSGAIALGIARALVRRNDSYEEALRDGKFLTRDSRVKERKKYGFAAARRSFQFSKR